MKKTAKIVRRIKRDRVGLLAEHEWREVLQEDRLRWRSQALADTRALRVAEAEVLRLRGLIDQHEAQAEARYSERATTAERNAAAANAKYDTLHRAVAMLLEPMAPFIEIAAELLASSRVTK